MTVSGPAGSPESDGVLPTRRQARALREAAASAAATAGPLLSTQAADDAGTAAVAVDGPTVPVPPVPVALVSPDLAVVVDSASASAVASGTDLEQQAQLSRPDTAPLGGAAPEQSVPSTPAAEYRRPALTPRRASASGMRPPASPTRSTARRGSSRRKPVAKIVTLLAIPVLFLTAALPAYAFSPQGGSGGVSVQATGETQALTVAAAAAAVSISTDGFTATSQAELDDIQAGLEASAARERAAAATGASTAAAEFAVYGIRAEGDDYPWPSAQIASDGGELSPLGYYYRECVDFVAWRLNRDAGTTSAPWTKTWQTLTPTGGDGSAWAAAWAAKGRPTSTTPVVGSVATFSYNHVAYVQSVPGDGTVVLEEYNWMGSHAYHTRTVPISAVKLFLYPTS